MFPAVLLRQRIRVDATSTEEDYLGVVNDSRGTQLDESIVPTWAKME